MDFNRQYNIYSELFSGGLQEFLDGLKQTGIQPRLFEVVRYSLEAGGKRFRPVLVFACCDAAGGNAADAMPFALAVELIHTYSLIHDDLPCMDDDDLRRGKPTSHKVFGEGMAVLAGDALLNFAYQVLLRHITRARTKYNVLAAEMIARCAGAQGMVGGQAMDLCCEMGECAADKKNLEFIHANKTGALLRASAAAGAYLAKANAKTVKHLSRYGELLGMLFQITDDILDETGTFTQLGKSTGKDKAQGKLTYVTLLGLDASRAAVQKYLRLADTALVKSGCNTDFLTNLTGYVAKRLY